MNDERTARQGFLSRIFNDPNDDDRTSVYSSEEVGTSGAGGTTGVQEARGFTVERAAEIIRNLPPEVPQGAAVRIVRNTLEAAGINVAELGDLDPRPGVQARLRDRAQPGPHPRAQGEDRRSRPLPGGRDPQGPPGQGLRHLGGGTEDRSRREWPRGRRDGARLFRASGSRRGSPGRASRRPPPPPLPRTAPKRTRISTTPLEKPTTKKRPVTRRR